MEPGYSIAVHLDMVALRRLALVLLIGCGDESGAVDGGNDVETPDSAAADAAGVDAPASDASELPDATTTDAPMDAAESDAGREGTLRLVTVGNWGLRGAGLDGDWNVCGNPSTGNDHSPDLLRGVDYYDGVFIAVGGDRNSMVMRSVDGIH